MFERYGYRFPDGTTDLTVEIWCFGNRKCSRDERAGHFRRWVDLCFNCDGSIRKVIWNEWLEKQLDVYLELLEQKRGIAAIAGSSSSGKSDFAGLFALALYWSRPTETTAMLLSTTKAGARNRIWKSMTQLWGQAKRKGCPGKLIDSVGKIKGISPTGQIWGNSGIELVAAGKSDVAEACSNLIGAKNPVVFVGADEMPDLGDGITEAMSNLSVNEIAIMSALGNPNLKNDPFGDAAEPDKGWASIGENDERWKTKYGGICLRLNAEKSPRIVDPDGEKYFWMPDQEYVDKVARDNGGKRSRAYYRFVKAFWCPEGVANTIFFESEFYGKVAMDTVEPAWDGTVTVLSALDPAFTRSGDRAFMAIGKVGKVNGRTHLHVCHETVIDEDIKAKGEPLSHQLATRWMTISKEWGVEPRFAVMDGTGSGISFGHIVDKIWSTAVEKINFGGKPTGRIGRSATGEQQDYYNRNSELWIQPKEFIRGGQISGLSEDTVKELIIREYHTKSSRMLRVEGKDEAKKKSKGVSPDRADAFLMLVDKSIGLGLFASEEKRILGKRIDKHWKKTVSKRNLSNALGKRLRF